MTSGDAGQGASALRPLVTGLGTIDAAKFVPDLAALAQQELGGG
jgi:hypothetical protein